MVIADSGSVHPRLRGELFKIPRYYDRLLGSSPLTRGTLFTVTGTFLCGRFIPAYAGNSEWRLRSRLLQPVHPRLRGELMVYGTAQDAAGFIPAYAGNSIEDENEFNKLDGSSPLTRGTLCIRLW